MSDSFAILESSIQQYIKKYNSIIYPVRRAAEVAAGTERRHKEKFYDTMIRAQAQTQAQAKAQAQAQAQAQEKAKLERDKLELARLQMAQRLDQQPVPVSPFLLGPDLGPRIIDGSDSKV